MMEIKKDLLDYSARQKNNKTPLRKSFKIIRGLFHKYSAMLSFNKYKIYYLIYQRQEIYKMSLNDNLI